MFCGCRYAVLKGKCQRRPTVTRLEQFRSDQSRSWVPPFAPLAALQLRGSRLISHFCGKSVPLTLMRSDLKSTRHVVCRVELVVDVATLRLERHLERHVVGRGSRAGLPVSCRVALGMHQTTSARGRQPCCDSCPVTGQWRSFCSPRTGHQAARSPSNGGSGG